jgi:hypothetical protein
VYHGSYAKLDGLPVSQAYRSVLVISFDVHGGLLTRQVHHWSATCSSRRSACACCGPFPGAGTDQAAVADAQKANVVESSDWRGRRELCARMSEHVG